MSNQNVTMHEAREAINHLVQGVDPYTGQLLEKADFLQNPRIIGCFALMSEVLTKIIERQENRHEIKRDKFSMTKSQAEAIKFPGGDVGVKGIITAVNEVVDINVMTGLTIVSLYQRLKDMGILEKSSKDSVTKTVTTSLSSEYGIVTVKNTFQGKEYDRVMYTDKAKAYLRKQLPVWYN